MATDSLRSMRTFSDAERTWRRHSGPRAPEEPDAPCLDFRRPLLYGTAGHLAGLFKSAGDQRTSWPGSLPAAWIQGHGHAQVFGWIGSFVLGIGFYSQPTRGRSVLRIPLACFVFWTSGVAMRWAASIYGWHWRTLFAVSASFERLRFSCSLLQRHATNCRTGEGQAGEAADGALDGLCSLEHGGAFRRWSSSILLNALKLAIGGTDRRLSPRLRSEVPRASCLGIPCACGLGIFRAMAAHVPGDFEARRAPVSHCARSSTWRACCCGVSGWAQSRRQFCLPRAQLQSCSHCV